LPAELQTKIVILSGPYQFKRWQRQTQSKGKKHRDAWNTTCWWRGQGLQYAWRPYCEDFSTYPM